MVGTDRHRPDPHRSYCHTHGCVCQTIVKVHVWQHSWPQQPNSRHLDKVTLSYCWLYLLKFSNSGKKSFFSFFFNNNVHRRTISDLNALIAHFVIGIAIYGHRSGVVMTYVALYLKCIDHIAGNTHVPIADAIFGPMCPATTIVKDCSGSTCL